MIHYFASYQFIFYDSFTWSLIWFHRGMQKSLKFHPISTNPPCPVTTYNLNGVSYLQVGFTQHLELLSNTWSQSFQCTFWNAFALGFYNLVYFNRNLIHMVLIHWCLSHQLISLWGWSDIHEDYWDFLNNPLEYLKKKKTPATFAFPT